MDPWLSNKNGECDNESTENASDSFEDNFKPTVSDTLPDSKHYLEILENKLQKLKNDPDVLKQLADKREACMSQLLAGEADYEQDLDTPLNSSSLLRAVAPEKQALTTGEIVELIKYDRLNCEEDSDNSDTASR